MRNYSQLVRIACGSDELLYSSCGLLLRRMLQFSTCQRPVSLNSEDVKKDRFTTRMSWSPLLQAFAKPLSGCSCWLERELYV